MLGRTVSAGEGGEAGRLGAGGSSHGAVSSRSGAGPPPRSAAAPAAEDPQSAAALKPACPEGREASGSVRKVIRRFCMMPNPPPHRDAEPVRPEI